MAGQSNKIRIGMPEVQDGTFIAGIGVTPVTGAAVLVDGFGQLGTMSSSRRFKHDIRAMDGASEAILALKPVTFRYNKENDPAAIPQFGLDRRGSGKGEPSSGGCAIPTAIPYTVRYEQ